MRLQESLIPPDLDPWGGEAEPVGHLAESQQTGLAQASIPGFQTVVMSDSRHNPASESSTFARPPTALVEQRRDLAIGIVIQQPIHLRHHLGAGSTLLPSIGWDRQAQGFVSSALETQV